MTTETTMARGEVKRVHAGQIRVSDAHRAVETQNTLNSNRRALWFKSSGLPGFINASQQSLTTLHFIETCEPARATPAGFERTKRRQPRFTDSARPQAKTLNGLGDARGR